MSFEEKMYNFYDNLEISVEERFPYLLVKELSANMMKRLGNEFGLGMSEELA